MPAAPFVFTATDRSKMTGAMRRAVVSIVVAVFAVAYGARSRPIAAQAEAMPGFLHNLSNVAGGALDIGRVHGRRLYQPTGATNR